MRCVLFHCWELFVPDWSGWHKKIVGYMSRKFNPAQVRYCISRKELTSIIFSLKFFKVYLIGREVTVLSDHSALRYLFSTKELNDQWARHLDFLANFQVKFEYRPGSQQKISDYLSRAQQLRLCQIEANRPCPQCSSDIFVNENENENENYCAFVHENENEKENFLKNENRIGTKINLSERIEINY
jgi:hypothetical protein